MKHLLKETEASDPKAWAVTQQQIQSNKLKRTRLVREIEDLQSAILEAQMHDKTNDGEQYFVFLTSKHVVAGHNVTNKRPWL